ncbi:MAG: DUF192 domain-containing protein [Pseudomonadota bacterium]
MGERLRVLNQTRGTTLAAGARLADSWRDRFIGLMGSAALPAGEGLVLDPCSSIHMFFMRYPIDVVFASRELRVVGVVHAIRPWRMTRFYRGAQLAIELPAGTATETGTVLGDQLALEQGM